MLRLYMFDIPELKNDYQSLNFVREYFDKYGSITIKSIICNTLQCFITDKNCLQVKEKIKDVWNIDFQKENSLSIFLENYKALEFLDLIYRDVDARTRNEENYSRYIKWISYGFKSPYIPTCEFTKTEEYAILPKKVKFGYEITVVEFVKSIGENTFVFDTCIRVIPEFSYIVKLIPSLFIMENGYSLCCTYHLDFDESIKIYIKRNDNSLSELEAPFVSCLLFLEPYIHMKESF